LPRFHFHVHDHSGVMLDVQGRELADLDAARREAIKGARSILSYEVLQGLIDLTGRIDVADPDGRVLFSMPFLDTVRLRTP
jgi:hypothetical protein